MNPRRISSLSCSVAFVLCLATPLTAQGMHRVSVDSFGMQANSQSGGLVISVDGRFTFFSSYADNLVAGDTNGRNDAFIHDQKTGNTTRVSVSSSGVEGNLDSYGNSISADGRYVTFSSEATNLVPFDTNGLKDIFVHDRNTGTTSRVNVASSGLQANDVSFTHSISADGRFIAFASAATNLVPFDLNGYWDVFLHDRTLATTTRISVTPSGLGANGISYSPVISSDGHFVAFISAADNLVPNDTNIRYDILVYDRIAGGLTRASVDSTGLQSNGYCHYPAISADGRFVTFQSEATNLVPADTNDEYDIFVHDRQTGLTTRASVDSAGVEGDGHHSISSISDNGRYVAYMSSSTNLVAGDSDDWDGFLHDRQTGETKIVGLSSAGEQGNNPQFFGVKISGDGSALIFYSESDNLVPEDTNGFLDVFVSCGPTLSASGTCPGTMLFTASGEPGESIVFVWGTQTGGYVIPQGLPCASLQLDLVPLFSPQPGYVVAVVSPAGTATVAAQISPRACGNFSLQAVNLDRCTKSNLITP